MAFLCKAEVCEMICAVFEFGDELSQGCVRLGLLGLFVLLNPPALADLGVVGNFLSCREFLKSCIRKSPWTMQGARGVRSRCIAPSPHGKPAPLTS
mmetsp:Transcript_62605/g.145756  ORF Transcript_62605/g.145756 Transcript_62605/m.145756 type:complete len:96 (-) Transcript_62605:17-304(-)